MATTTFSGPIVSTNSFVIPGDTAANLGSSSADINTKYKAAGKLVRDVTNSKLYYASGADATDPWYSADKGATAGGADITPS